MKKAIVILLVGALSATLLLAACGKKEPADVPEGSGAASGSDALAGNEGGSSAGMALLGGWTLAPDLSVSLTEDDKAIFDKAMEGFTGVGYEPAAVLATQLVSGKNYAYLCKATPVTSKPIPHWAVVVIYQNLQGEASVSNVTEIDLTNPNVKDNVDTAAAVGAWEITLPGGKPIMMPYEDAQVAFDTASQKYVGVDLKPLSLLGTQVVAGKNYKYLCYGETVTETPVSALYIVDVYQDLEGNAEITNCAVLDLLSYIG